MNAKFGRKLSAIVASTGLVVGGVLMSSMPAMATTSPAPEIPSVPQELTVQELQAVGATQDAAEINAVLATASADQEVQLLIDPDTWEYVAAVQVEESPEQAELTDTITVAPKGAAQARAISSCSTSTAKGVSYHVMPDRTYGWCGSGTWTNGSLSNFYQYVNKTKYNHIVGKNKWEIAVCPGYTTCKYVKSFTLGFIEFK